MTRGRFTPRRSTVGLVVVLLVVAATTALVLDVMTTAGARHRASDAPLFDRAEVALDAASPDAGFTLQPSALRTDRMVTGCMTVLVGGAGPGADVSSATPSAVVLHGRAPSGDVSSDHVPSDHVPSDHVMADSDDDGVRLRIRAEAGHCPDGDPDTDAAAARGTNRFDGRAIDLTTEHPDLENGLTLATIAEAGAGAGDRDAEAIAVTATASIDGDPDLDRLADLLLTVELKPTG